MNSKHTHLLHIFPNFGIGGVELRMARVLNHFNNQFRHTIVSLNNNLAAAEHLRDDIHVRFIRGAKQREGPIRAIGRAALALSRFRPDLLLTYNWGAMEWAMANRLFRISSHIHFESGFGQDEADRQLRRRILFRRWALHHCDCIVVPSRLLDALACNEWRLPADRVRFIPNGIDLTRFSAIRRRPFANLGSIVIGTVAPLRPEKNLPRLLRVFSKVRFFGNLSLVIAGDGPERPRLAELAEKLGIADRVVFPGYVLPETVLGGIDIFALSSDTEQMPNALLEAMASGCPVVAVDVGDIKKMVCEDNRDFIIPRDDERLFVGAIEALIKDPNKRLALGLGNRARVQDEFSQEEMFNKYDALFRDVTLSISASTRRMGR